MWSLADCVEYFNTKKMIYVSYFAVKNHSARESAWWKSDVCCTFPACARLRNGLCPVCPRGPFGRYRNISSESIVPDYTLCCLVLSTKPATRSQYPEIWANCSHPNSFLVHFLGQNKFCPSLNLQPVFMWIKLYNLSSPFPPFVSNTCLLSPRWPLTMPKKAFKDQNRHVHKVFPSKVGPQKYFWR